MKMDLRKEKGITLVALIITIVILIILAAVAISSIMHDGFINVAINGTQNYANEQYREADEISRLTDKINDAIDEMKVEELPENALAKKVEIGDYVAYDPTAGVTDVNKLQYTSPVGTGMSHGSGATEEAASNCYGEEEVKYGDQTFKATSNTKWRVLSKDERTGEVVLISDKPIQSITGQNFLMSGPIGYLYAEQELNEICKIYGYGKGADTSKTFTYKTGDVVEGETTHTMQGSGARSINADDLNRITKYDPTTYRDDYAKYGDSFTHEIYYPSTKIETGISESTKKRTDIFTSYHSDIYYSSTSIEQEVIESFNPEIRKIKLTDSYFDLLCPETNTSGYGYYWLSTRGVEPSESASDYCVFMIVTEERAVFEYGLDVSFGGLCFGSTSTFGTQFDGWYGAYAYGVRPLVYLNPNLETTEKDENGYWIINE